MLYHEGPDLAELSLMQCSKIFYVLKQRTAATSIQRWCGSRAVKAGSSPETGRWSLLTVGVADLLKQAQNRSNYEDSPQGGSLP